MGIIAKSYDTNRQVLGKVLPLDTPFTVILDVSEVCNFKCKFCFRSDIDKSSWGYARKNNLMSDEVFFEAIKQMKKFPSDIKQISLSNQGEPLCNPRIPDMIKKIHEMNFSGRTSIHTNASLLRGDLLKRIIEANPGRVIVSLEGLSDEAYFDTCGVKVNFDELRRNIKYFYEHKIDTQLCVKIMNSSLKQGEEQKFYDMFLESADRVFVEQEIKIWKNIDVASRNHVLDYNKYGDGFKPQKVCPLIFHTIVVTPDGDVYPCTQICGTKKLGNIFDKSLTEIWNGEERKKLLIEQLTYDEQPTVCIGCGIKQNTVYSEEDMIDDYRSDILGRFTS